jgi:hypothetical protein
MKKVLLLVVALFIVTSLAASSFAYENITPTQAYD